jgi:hypothetical protein
MRGEKLKLILLKQENALKTPYTLVDKGENTGTIHKDEQKDICLIFNCFI